MTPDSSDFHPPSAVARFYLDGLNSGQAEAVETIDGAVLVLAGAGTGKTRVLVARLAHILATRRAWPSQILAVTFTNKAAREMKERVGALVGGAVEGMWLGTFHAVSARILRRHAEAVGLKSNFTILADDDQVRLVKQLLAAENIDDKRWPARLIAAVIARFKDKGLGPEQVTVAEAGDLLGGRMATFYAAYQQRLATLNAADFGDLLLHVVRLFEREAELLADYRRRFRYLLVDEYQDSNAAQHRWLKLLAGSNGNLCCVGDDDQSIYGWRGAEVGNILGFSRDYPGAKVIRLERNYRSTGHILGAASGLIARNAGRLGKTLWTEDEAGDKVRVVGVWDGDEEARFVGDEVEAGQAKGESLDDMAILVRASFQTRPFEDRFVTLGVPYRVVGGLRFYERAEVRDALAYLRVVNQPDDDLAFERILNVPKRGLGDAAVQRLHLAARGAGTSLYQAARGLVETDELKPKPRKALADLIAGFERWRAQTETLGHVEVAEMVLDESGYTGALQADKSIEAEGRLDNLKELVRAMAEFENLGGFLEHVALVMDNETESGEAKVSLMTLHAAKGLEFATVFLPGWEEGVFPNQRTLDEGGGSGLEEERRLAYVGLTRARRRAIVSFAANRRIHDRWQNNPPSRFIEELPAEHVEIVAARGLHAGASPVSGFDDAPSRVFRGSTWTNSPRIIEAKANRLPESGPRGRFKLGDRVRHGSFGLGKVVSVEGDKLGIAFEKGGAKKVMAAFVEPAT